MRIRKVTPQELGPQPRRWTIKLQHPTYVIEPCQHCGFPEADGGYCPECGRVQHSTGCNCRSR